MVEIESQYNIISSTGDNKELYTRPNISDKKMSLIERYKPMRIDSHLRLSLQIYQTKIQETKPEKTQSASSKKKSKTMKVRTSSEGPVNNTHVSF